jgi:D-alanyl-D-alanine-carboxypeptidase/D-alanyl-D-alanine-endopeptidase
MSRDGGRSVISSMQNRLQILLLALIAGWLSCEAALGQGIQSRLDFLVQQHRVGGITGALVSDRGVEYFKAGEVARNWNLPLRDSLFEVGEVSMMFTSLLVAESVRVNKMRLDQPIKDLFPDDFEFGSTKVAAITIRELLIHRSGLPRVPLNFIPASGQDPYADYSRARLIEFLIDYEPEELRKSYRFSQLGYGLLSYLLDRAWNKEFEKLLKGVVLEPLRMNSSTIQLSDQQKPRLVAGYAGRQSKAPWNFQVLEGAGGLRSTPSDLANCVQAFLNPEKSMLTHSLGRVLKGSNPIATDGSVTDYGWRILRTRSTNLFWHDGRTGGFQTILAMDLKRRMAFVLTANNSAIRFSPALIFELMELSQTNR